MRAASFARPAGLGERRVSLEQELTERDRFESVKRAGSNEKSRFPGTLASEGYMFTADQGISAIGFERFDAQAVESLKSGSRNG